MRLNRKLLLAFTFSFGFFLTQAQNNSVSIGSPTTNSSAVLWLNSPNQNQGFILPVGNRNNVTTPTKGMVIFDTNQIYFHDGTNWNAVSGAGGKTYTLNVNANNQLVLSDGTTSTPLSVPVAGDVTGTSLGSTTVIALKGKPLPANFSAGVLTSDASGNLTWSPGGSGTVLSVTGGTGLTGGTITNTGTLAVDVGTTANKIVQLDANGKLPPVDGSQLTNLPAGTETDPTVKAINGIVKSNGTTIGAAVSGTDIKTINSTSLLGSGNITVVTAETDPAVKAINGLVKSNGSTIGAAVAGTDYQAPLVSGTNIKTINGTSVLGSGNITALTAETDPTVKAISGIVKSNGTTISAAVAGTDYIATESDPSVKAISGIVKSNGTTISAAVAGTDYQAPLVSGTNIKTINGTSVLGSGNITALTAETDPTVKAISGIVKSNGTTISAAVAGTDYVATESDPSVKAISGIVKSNGTTISAAAAGTDYQAPVTLTTTGSSGAATFSSNTLNVPNYTLAGLGGISLTSLSAATPLTYNNTTGAFGIGKATTSTDGYLTAADWNTFTGKVSLAGDLGGTAASPLVLKVNGSAWPTNASGVLTNDGSGNLSWTSTSGTGTVTQVNAGTGLTGGPITTSGTLAVDVGTTPGKIVQLDANAKLPAVDGSQLTNLPTTAETDPVVKAINGLVKSNGSAISAAVAGTDYQAPLTLTTTGTSGAATLVGNTLNIPSYAATSYSAGTGLTLATNTFSVNTSQNISTLSNLTSNGLIKTSGGTGALSIATPGTDYLITETDATVKAINGIVKSNGTTISAAVAGTDYVATESDPTVKAINGLVKSNGTTISSAVAGTDYLAPNGNGSALTNLSASNITSGTLGIANGGTGATTAPLARTALGLGTLSTLNTITTSEITDGTIADADISATAGIADSKLATISTAGKVSGSAITSGTIGGSTALNTTGNISTSGTLSAGATTLTALTIGTSVWPANASGSLTNDGAGNLTWVPSGGSGTVTSVAAGTGLTGGPITTSGTLSVDVGTTANKIVQLDATGKLPALDGSQLTNLPAGTETDPTVKAINGLVKSNGTTISAAVAGTDYLSPTGSAAGLTGFPILNQNTTGSAASFTGALGGDVTGTQSATVVGKINGTSLSALSTGLLKNTTGTGVPTIAVAGTDYLVTETDATVKAINGIVKSNGTTISAATAGTDYQAPLVSGTNIKTINGASVLGTGNITAITTETDPTVTAISGIVKSNGTTISAALAGTDYVATESDPTVKAISGIVKSNGTTISAAVSGTDFAPATSGTSLLKGNGTGGFANAVAGTDYLTANQTITLSGDVSGSGTSAITTAIGASKVTNTMLAGSIAASKLIGTDINTVGTITTGTWNGTKISEASGGTNQTTYAPGDMLYASASNVLSKLGIGTAGQVLTVAGGVPTWATATSGWGLTGNAGTDGGTTNFIGTTDAKDVAFRANNVEAMRIYQSGQIGIGSAPVSAKLEVSSSNTTIGVHGGATFSNTQQNRGVQGDASGSTSQNIGVYASGNNTSAASGAIGLYGEAIGTGSSDAVGVYAVTPPGFLVSSGTAYALYASSQGAATNWAGYFGNGNVHITNGLSVGTTPGNYGTAGQVLTSSGPGVAPIWNNASSGWGLTGNAGTVDGTNFIGTTDNVPLNFKVNNQNAGRIEQLISGSTFLGWSSGTTNTGGQNAAFGSQAMEKNTTGGANVAFGQLALNSNTTASYNVAIGALSMSANTTGGNNIAVGVQANKSNTIGGFNTAIGYNANYGNVSSNDNTGIGGEVLFTNTGAGNTAVGRTALYGNATGSYNTAIGWAADLSVGGLTNATAIGANAKATSSNTIQLGDGLVTTVNVGTGTTAKLVAGGLQITGGTLAAGAVLTSDVSGNATWQAAGSGWGLTGNAGTVDGTNFIGTTDNVPLNFKVNSQKAGRIEAGANSSTFFGYQSGNVNTSTLNTGIGYQTLLNNTTGSENTAIGVSSLIGNVTGSYNTAMGSSALQNNTGNSNTAIGRIALAGNTTGSSNVAVGSQAVYQNSSGSANTGIGDNALRSILTTNNNTAVGASSLFLNTGSSNTAIGASSLTPNTTGSNNVGIGYNTLTTNTTGSNNTAVGYQADVSSAALTNSTAIGSNAKATASNTIQLGDLNVTTVNVGTGTTAKLVAGGLQITGGAGTAGQVLTSDASGNATWQAAGAGSGWSLTGNGSTVDGTNFIGPTNLVPFNIKINGSQAGRIDPTLLNTYYGYQSGTTTGSNNTGLGYFSLTANVAGTDNVALGYAAMKSNRDGKGNVAVGKSALFTIHADNSGTSYVGTYNTAIGYESLYYTESTPAGSNGYHNAALGYQSGYNNTTGDHNTFVGDVAGSAITTGTNNTFLGNSANASIGTLINATAIGANAYVGASNSMVLGSISGVNGATADTNVGIGTTAPQNLLDVNGTASIRAGLIVGTPSNGNQQLQVSLGSGYSLMQAINPSVAFNNLVINPSGGYVGIGTLSPSYPLDISGSNTYTPTNGGEYLFNGQVGGVNTTRNISIRVSNTMLASSFLAISDKRIKENIKTSNPSLDLKTLMRLGVVDYDYIDKMKMGNSVQKGFIAQQVQEVYPEAVNVLKSGEFVPSIYALAENVKQTDDVLTIQLPKAHDLKIGDRVRIMTKDGEFKEKVTGILSQNTFQVSNSSIPVRDVFIYGKEVSDFYTVDYDRIYTLGISAIQELNRKLEAQQQVIDSLRAQDSESKKKIAALEASLSKASSSETDLKSLKAEIEKIKQTLNMVTTAKKE